MLEDYLRYDKDTGKVFWTKKSSPKSRIPAGVEAGSLNTVSRYPVIRFKGVNYLLHRVCWYLYYGEWPKDQIDHINRNKRDNRIENLRDVTQRINNQNKEKFNFGASFHNRDQVWHSQISVDKKKKHLGYFNTEKEAQMAYKNYVLEHGL